VNLQDVRKGLGELREGLKMIRQELKEHLSDVDNDDRYPKHMWVFLGWATNQLENLVDNVNTAETIFTEVVKYFGEDDKNMSSTEFYGIFKTFITSYRVSRMLLLRRNCQMNILYRNAKWRIVQHLKRN
jgi:cytokinesis protein